MEFLLSLFNLQLKLLHMIKSMMNDRTGLSETHQTGAIILQNFSSDG